MAVKIDASHVIHEESGHVCSGIVIFLHGAGDTGPGVQAWTEMALQNWKGVRGSSFSFPHLKIIYPTAPKRKYTADRGRQCTVWFDWPRIDPAIPEDLESIDVACESISALISDVIQRGTPAHRILIGGLSMGGVVALHVAYRYRRDVAGVFALSTFLHDNSVVFETLRDHPQPLPPLYQAHGESDALIRNHWGRATFEMLSSLGVHGQFHSYPNLQHSMGKEELQELKHWVSSILPDNEGT